jgi:uncharacterized protein involved in copper resistance
MRSFWVIFAFSALFCLTLIPNETTAAAAKEQDHKEDGHHDTSNHDGANPDTDHHDSAHPDAEPEAHGKDHKDGADEKHAAGESEPEPEPEHHSEEDDSNAASNVGFAPAFLLLPFLALVFQR